jgi:hypothetical protein
MSTHLLKFGFTSSYNTWTFHGEKAKKRARKEVRQIQPRGEYDTGFDRYLENLANGNGPKIPHVEVETPQDAETSEEPEENTKQYYEALFASQKPPHENIEVTQLDAIARLMTFKCHRNLCRDGFNELLVVIGSILPKGHLFPQNFYYSTKLLSDLKMSCQQIHACPKGCMLFRWFYTNYGYVTFDFLAFKHSLVDNSCTNAPCFTYVHGCSNTSRGLRVMNVCAIVSYTSCARVG